MKQYFSTNTLNNNYPSEFIESQAPKRIEVLRVSLIYEDPEESTDTTKVYEEIDHAQLHASFVQENDCMDHYVCEVNTDNIVKEYCLHNNERSFRLWFTDYASRPITIDENHHFVVELRLNY